MFNLFVCNLLLPCHKNHASGKSPTPSIHLPSSGSNAHHLVPEVTFSLFHVATIRNFQSPNFPSLPCAYGKKTTKKRHPATSWYTSLPASSSPNSQRPTQQRYTMVGTFSRKGLDKCSNEPCSLQTASAEGNYFPSWRQKLMKMLFCSPSAPGYSTGFSETMIHTNSLGVKPTSVSALISTSIRRVWWGQVGGRIEGRQHIKKTGRFFKKFSWDKYNGVTYCPKVIVLSTFTQVQRYCICHFQRICRATSLLDALSSIGLSLSSDPASNRCACLPW